MEQKMRIVWQDGEIVGDFLLKKEKISFGVLLLFKHKHIIKNSVPVITESCNQLVMTHCFFIGLCCACGGWNKITLRNCLTSSLDLMLLDFSSNQIVNISHYSSLLAIVDKHEQNWVSVNPSSLPPSNEEQVFGGLWNGPIVNIFPIFLEINCKMTLKLTASSPTTYRQNQSLNTFILVPSLAYLSFKICTFL